MSKKKSYMDKDNILSEGFLEFLRKKLVQIPALKKDKNVQKSLNKLNSSLKDVEKELNKRWKELDPKHKPVKLSKYKETDFI